MALCMFNYMTPLKGIAIDPALTRWRGRAGGRQARAELCGWVSEGATCVGYGPCSLVPTCHVQTLTTLLTHPPYHRRYEAEGHDMQSLLFNFLDELLFSFSTEFFVPSQLRITSFDRQTWQIKAEGCGAA